MNEHQLWIARAVLAASLLGFLIVCLMALGQAQVGTIYKHKEHVFCDTAKRVNAKINHIIDRLENDPDAAKKLRAFAAKQKSVPDVQGIDWRMK